MGRFEISWSALTPRLPTVFLYFKKLFFFTVFYGNLFLSLDQYLSKSLRAY